MTYPMPTDGRLIIVTNRLPVTLQIQGEEITCQSSAGGLATSLNNLRENPDVSMIWLGWPGITHNDPGMRQKIEAYLNNNFDCLPVFIEESLFNPYYHGFSNRCVWPLFHYFAIYAHYNASEWEAYQAVNRLFLDKLLDILQPGDRVWIHDYQLMLLPGYLREARPDTSIGYFHHIPFPSYELFRMLPWRKEILEGLLGSDLIGFHSYSYARHFLSSVLRLLGLEQEFGEVILKERTAKVDFFPLGVNVDHFHKTTQEKATKKAYKELQEQTQGHQVILAVDRLDFTKGLIERLDAFDLFLEEYPEYQGKVLFIMLCVPSREDVPEYHSLKRELDEKVGNINGRFGRPGWNPVWYLYRQIPFPQLVAMYQMADVAMITPLRDGMNLVAKEYLACHKDLRGVLILSETAGAAEELGEALTVNPHDQRDMCFSLYKALTMKIGEQKNRNRAMLERLGRYNNERWWMDFLGEMEKTKQNQMSLVTIRLKSANRRELIQEYKKASERLLLLDYDGTLVAHHASDKEAPPGARLLQILKNLQSDPRNTIVILSSRNHQTMEKWLGKVGLHMVAEHGACIREHGKTKWEVLVDPNMEDWKHQVKPLLEVYVDRTPGAQLEEKPESLAWHYRFAEPELGSLRAKELVDSLSGLISNKPLQILQGNKVIEVQSSHISKSQSAQHFINACGSDCFVLAMGDDITDEDVFNIVPKNSWSIKVGRSVHSNAGYYLRDTTEVIEILKQLSEPKGKEKH